MWDYVLVVVLSRMAELTFATAVPANAKKRNMVVPTISPMEATMWFFMLLFMNRAQLTFPGIFSAGGGGEDGWDGGESP